MKAIQLLITTSIVLGSSFFSFADSVPRDFESARTLAAREKKDLLIEFTSSDWSARGMQLESEIFSREEFKSAADNTFVTARVDVPEDPAKAGLSETALQRNFELQTKYGIQNFPAVVLADANGVPYAVTGYQPGGPAKYLAHLEGLRAKKTARDESVTAAMKLQGPDRAKALRAVLDGMGLDDAMIAAFYFDVVREIKKADPADPTGYAQRIETKERFARFRSKLNQYGLLKDYQGALDYVELALNVGGFEWTQRQQLVSVKAMILAKIGRFTDAFELLDAAKQATADSRAIEGFESQRKRIERLQEETSSPRRTTTG